MSLDDSLTFICLIATYLQQTATEVISNILQFCVILYQCMSSYLYDLSKMLKNLFIHRQAGYCMFHLLFYDCCCFASDFIFQVNPVIAQQLDSSSLKGKEEIVRSILEKCDIRLQ